MRPFTIYAAKIVRVSNGIEVEILAHGTKCWKVSNPSHGIERLSVNLGPRRSHSHRRGIDPERLGRHLSKNCKDTTASMFTLPITLSLLFCNNQNYWARRKPLLKTIAAVRDVGDVSEESLVASDARKRRKLVRKATVAVAGSTTVVELWASDWSMQRSLREPSDDVIVIRIS